MEIIKNNPYRIAGILSNASARDVQRQKGKIQAFANVGREIESDYDFQFLSTVTRTAASINRAFSNIQQNPDKVNYALFWFLDASPYDVTAFDYLKSGNEEKAIEIWEKVTFNKEVNSKNFSAFNNLGTYKLLGGTKGEIKEGIEAKLKLIESDFFENFIHSVADENFTIRKEKQIEKLIDELLTQFNSKYSSLETLQMFSNCNGSTQKYLSKKFTEEPIHKIEVQIESTKKKRNQNKSQAYEFGLRLYVNSKDDLSLLKTLLGTNDLKYKMIADNVAQEIMQCGIDYFKEWQETKDPSEEGLKLLKYAKSIAVGSQTKDRVKENIEGIQEWAETAPIKAELEFVMKKLIDFRNKMDSISAAKDLVTSCKPKLQAMKNILGSNNEEYLNMSTAVANNAVGMLVNVINEEQNSPLVQIGHFDTLKTALRGALSVSKEVDEMDMKTEQRNHFNANYRTLKSIASQLGVSAYSSGTSTNKQYSSSTSRTTSSSTSTSSDNEGIPDWLKWVGGIILFIILIKACN